MLLNPSRRRFRATDNKYKQMKTLLVFGEKTFRITVPANSKITFGPWSPFKGDKSGGLGFSERALNGTLRIYDTSKNVIAVFSGVTGYRDVSLNYAEQVAKEEGAVIWKSDQSGYEREDKVVRKNEWVAPQLPEFAATPAGRGKKVK